MKHLCLVRGMTTKEADHGRGTFLMRTGYLPQGPIQYPTLGSLVSKELGHSDHPLPNFVSIAPFRFLSPGAYDSGFLGPKYAPLFVGEGGPGGFIGAPGQQQDVASQLKISRWPTRPSPRSSKRASSQSSSRRSSRSPASGRIEHE